MSSFKVRVLSHTVDIERERDFSRTPKISGTYIIENDKKELYVGSSGNLTRRLASHRRMIEKGTHPYEALNNNPVNVVVIQTDDREQAFDLEQKFLDGYRNNPGLLNKAMNARFPGQGLSPSEENIEAIKKAHTGKVVSEETRRKLSEANIGKILSQEQKDYLRKINTGKINSEETRKKISEALAGKPRQPHSDEAKQRMSDAKKGKPLSPLAYAASVEPRKKKVEIEGRVYSSLVEAGKTLGMTPEGVAARIKNNNFENYKFI